jgi:hypothetical protein
MRMETPSARMIPLVTLLIQEVAREEEAEVVV